MMQHLLSFYRKLYIKFPVLLFDILAIPLAWMLSYWLRYNLHPFILPLEKPEFYSALLILVVVQTACYYYFNVYRGLWRFTSISDVIRILRAVSCAVMIVIPIYFLTSLLTIVPRSVFPLYAMIASIFLCGSRFIRRHSWD